MPLTPGRRFMGLLRAHWMRRGERRGSSCSHHPWGPCLVPVGQEEVPEPRSPSRPPSVPLEAPAPARPAPTPLCPPNESANPMLMAKVPGNKS